MYCHEIDIMYYYMKLTLIMLLLGVPLHCNWCIRNWHGGPQSWGDWYGARSSLHHLEPNW